MQYRRPTTEGIYTHIVLYNIIFEHIILHLSLSLSLSLYIYIYIKLYTWIWICPSYESQSSFWPLRGIMILIVIGARTYNAEYNSGIYNCYHPPCFGTPQRAVLKRAPASLTDSSTRLVQLAN